MLSLSRAGKSREIVAEIHTHHSAAPTMGAHTGASPRRAVALFSVDSAGSWSLSYVCVLVTPDDCWLLDVSCPDSGSFLYVGSVDLWPRNTTGGCTARSIVAKATVDKNQMGSRILKLSARLPVCPRVNIAAGTGCLWCVHRLIR